MNILVFLLFVCIFTVVFLNKRILIKAVRLKSLILPAACVLLILCLVIFSKTSVKAAHTGLNLWLNVVFPSLFPFFVVSSILNKTGFIRKIGKVFEPIMRPLFNVPGCGAFAFAMGIISGYPVGATITADLREKGLISKIEGERLLTFTNNSGPLFIIGAVAVGMFNIPQIGLILLGCHIAAGITVGIIYRFYKGGNKTAKNNKVKLRQNHYANNVSDKEDENENFGTIFGNAVRSSINTILAIGGFIIFFSVIINILLELGVIDYIAELISVPLSPIGIERGIIKAALSGAFEITTGTKLASTAAEAGLIGRLTTVSLIIGWAGFSVHSQVLSVIGNTDISIKPYLLGKLLQGIISAIYTYCTLLLVGDNLNKSVQTFKFANIYETETLLDNFLLSCETLLGFILLFAALYMIVSAVRFCVKKLVAKRVY